MVEGRDHSGGLRANRPGVKSGGAPLRATVGEPARPGIALRAEIGTSGRGATAAPLRPAGPRPAAPKSKLPLVMLALIAVAGAGLWYFSRNDDRLDSFPAPQPEGVAPGATQAGASPGSPPPNAPPIAPAKPDTPVIAGSAEPYKERPVDPGGVDVPFKESLVYNDLKPAPGQTPPQRVERLLPPPEEPLPKPAPVIESTPVANVTPGVAASPSEGGSPTVAASPDDSGAVAVGERPEVASVAEAPAPVEAPKSASTGGVLGQLPVAPGSPEAEALKEESDKKQEDKRTSLETTAIPSSGTAEPGSLEDVFRRLGTPGAGPAETPGAATDDRQVAAAPSGGASVTAASDAVFRIQLASVRSEAEAQAEWRRLSARYPNELGALSPVFEKADLAQGTFFRVQAGPLSEAQARARCAALNGQPGVSGCQPVRRAASP
jgi:hypothetical protein